MLPDPLHPAIVHFPVALSVLLPIMVLIGMIVHRRGTSVWAAWLPTVFLAVFMLGAGLVAQETGEDEEDVVEEVVSRSVIHEHEERAEVFVWGAGVLALLSLVGFAGSAIGNMARWLTLVGAIVVLVLGYRVGESGGDIVYEHNAGAAYATPAAVDSGGSAVRDDD